MNFRYDINGLRAIAVIAVVLFHFNADWLPGGFAGVDVFFVISGFLMTSIVVRGIDTGEFNLVKFYIARANRIVPALALLCLVMLVLGWLMLLPEEYAALGKHVAGSVSFLSNIVYWQEAGYFDAASHEKWLLHTWSLAVEWQFYLLYPLVLIALAKLGGSAGIKRGVLALTIVAFIYSALTSVIWPSASYYLLGARTWELLFGGLAYLYPLPAAKQRSRLFNLVGIALIVIAYVLIDERVPWPGYMAMIPVAGTYLVLIASTQGSVLTNNPVFQPLGRWSYSIYLWHWPVVVFGYRYDINWWWIPGMALCVLLGFLSYRYIENIKWRRIHSLQQSWQAKPLWLAALVMVMGGSAVSYQGYPQRFDAHMQALIESARFSPYRDQCHFNEYQPPNEACEYFEDDVTWAILGDSHAVELAYALAERLRTHQQGLKHYSFSGCVPSLLEQNGSSRCTRWYSEALQDIIDDERITTVLINHRYSWAVAGDHAPDYPHAPAVENEARAARIFAALDTVINKLANAKKTVYVMYPVPEISRPATALIAQHFAFEAPDAPMKGTTMNYYKQRNQAILTHLQDTRYPPNVVFVKPTEALCKNGQCNAIEKGKSLYFDDNHPSVEGARTLIKLLPEQAFTHP